MSEELKLSVASSPHASSPVGTKNLMLDVLIALIPAMLMGIYVFGPRALTLTLVSVIACEVFEYIYCAILKKPIPNGDFSAAITGVLLAFVCPVTLPYWTIIIGDLFAIIIVKQLFGGLGTNFLNPALGGRAFLMMCYPVPMTTWVAPGTANWAGLISAADATTQATPLSVDFMKAGTDALANTTAQYSLTDMFIGTIGGCVGEVSAIALLIGGIYLIVRGVIRIRIPAAYILTVAVLTLIFSRSGSHFDVTWMLREIFAGGLFLGAFFMATDYVTSPNTPKGEIIFGIGAGLLVVFIRYYGGYPEGVCYSILIMNVCVWLIDKIAPPARFGVTKEMRQAEKEKAKAAKKAAKEGAEA